MSGSLRHRWMILSLFLCIVTGCGYHLTNGRSGLFVDARNIWIPFFNNESISSTAQTVLRRSFYEELHALRGLNPAKHEETADLVMKARLISYSSQVVSYNIFDQAKEYRLSLSVELELLKKGQSVPLWKGQLQGTKQYPASTILALQRNSEDQALEAVARIIAQKFISASEESY